MTKDVQREIMHTIDDQLKKVTARIALACKEAHRNCDEVHLIAVSKTQAAAALREAYNVGQYAFGENYLQEALDKQLQLADLTDITWHFIGPIQSNKTRPIAENFAWVHSVDRLKIAERLSQQRPTHLPPLNICLQVNIDDETTKSGVSLNELPALAEAVRQLPRVQLRGLMTIPAPTDAPELQRRAFAQLTQAFQDLNAKGFGLDTLSMGMSADLESAIAEGATMVRVGSDIFGARAAKVST